MAPAPDAVSLSCITASASWLCRPQVQDQAVSRCQQGWLLLTARGGVVVWRRICDLRLSLHRWLLVFISVPRLVNERVLNRLHQVQRITRRLQQERRFLMRVLDTYGDDYRTSQLTIVLEDEGSQGTDAPTPGNAENEPPEKEGLSPPRRTPAPPEPSSPTPAEGPSGRKRRRAPRDGRRAGAVLTPELAPVQIKVEEDFGFEADEALDSSWVSRGPDRLLPYPTLASPPFD
ncbi:TCF3 fusion partner isoform X4 [Mirounga angustirostris]|uniref:TCF3 fusion partner isoform X4 n=1 Tax=Mirounga angustirostris TaxID=9716 RepID=UPI00313DD421